MFGLNCTLMITMEETAERRGAPGRPRSFDRARALHAAMLAFWAHGYEGTSLTALTTAMGVTPPSLYAAFGNKEKLFLEAVRLYTGDMGELAAHLEAAPTAKEAAEAFLYEAAITYTGTDTPPGCLLASSVASGSPGSTHVQRAVAGIRAHTTTMLSQRIQRDVDEGRLAADTDATTQANLIVALTQGMSVLARDGAPRETLVALIQTLMQRWPPGD